MNSSVYIGTVIANDDPEYAGRVKVRIEGITPTLSKESVSYKFPVGSNISGSLTQRDIDITRASTVWALVAGPVSSEGSAGRYNRERDLATSADVTTSDNMDRGSNNYDSSGRDTPPAVQFERTFDRFADGPSVVASKTNTYAYSYMSQSYPNTGKGTFCVPAVGTKVVVSYVGGRFREPIIIGQLSSQNDIQSIYGGFETGFPSYPGVYENSSKE